MKGSVFILFIMSFSFPVSSQIKSEKQVNFHSRTDASKSGFHDNTSKDSCILFWEEYNPDGKITIQYDFPSDRCWKINGPWEQHYFYDSTQRIIEHRDFGGEEGDDRKLMRNHFYSYPYLNKPNQANEITLVYDFAAWDKVEQEKIDTIYTEEINTKGMYTFFRNSWVFDTIKFDQGIFIFREDFNYKKELFKPILIGQLINKETVKEFEIALIKNINELSRNLDEIYLTKNEDIFEFTFKEKNERKAIHVKKGKGSINIEYRFINKHGDDYLTYYYYYYIDGKKLKKYGFVKSYIEYY